MSDRPPVAGSIDGPPSNLESVLRLEIAPDGLYCALVVLPHAPPINPFELPALVSYLKKNKLKTGIQPSAVHAALERLNTFSRVEQAFTIAVGTFPKIGAEVLIQPAVSLAVPGPNDLDRAQAFASAAVEACGSVSRGELIAEVRVDESLSAGKTVTGETLPPISGALTRLELGEGVEATLDEERLLVHALRDGMVLLHPPKIDVLPVEIVQGPLELLGSGDEYDGHLLVIGRVSGAAPLEAKGHLFVTDVVDSAQLRAGGSIVLGGSFLGRQRGTVFCRGNFASRSAEQCEIDAGGSVYVLTNAAQSTIASGSRVSIRGTLAGGSTLAGLEISAKQLGSPRGIPTKVALDPERRYLSHRKQLQSEISQLENEWATLDRTSLRFRPRGAKQQNSNQESPELAQIRAQQSLVAGRLAQLVSEEGRIAQMAREDSGSGAIVATETVQPGVLIRVNDAVMETVSTGGAARARLSNDGLSIELENLGGEAP
ncbi:MAG: hypothetical protein CME06_05800 [Gemmatimonadetes bacterium]|nr:hypothetical protein [Gemmatimonadota bacterium]